MSICFATGQKTNYYCLLKVTLNLSKKSVVFKFFAVNAMSERHINKLVDFFEWAWVLLKIIDLMFWAKVEITPLFFLTTKLSR